MFKVTTARTIYYLVKIIFHFYKVLKGGKPFLRLDSSLFVLHSSLSLMPA